MSWNSKRSSVHRHLFIGVDVQERRDPVVEQAVEIEAAWSKRFRNQGDILRDVAIPATSLLAGENVPKTTT